MYSSIHFVSYTLYKHKIAGTHGHVPGTLICISKYARYEIHVFLYENAILRLSRIPINLQFPPYFWKKSSLFRFFFEKKRSPVYALRSKWKKKSEISLLLRKMSKKTHGGPKKPTFSKKISSSRIIHLLKAPRGGTCEHFSVFVFQICVFRFAKHINLSL